MKNEFWLGIDNNGEYIVKPVLVPKTKEDALITIKALEIYYSNYPNLYLDLQNAKEYFDNLERLLSE